jgi:LPXTG-motif cell wall-anchored protein
MSLAAGRLVLVVGTLVCLTGPISAQQTTRATETKRFEVIAVTGNQLDVRLPEGTREITVPDDFRFTVDGRQMSVHELKPGMRGTANITTSTTVTPVTITEVKNGTVVQTGGGAIYVRTNEGIKMFTQGDVDKRGVKIMRDGEPASVSDFRSGDKLSATIVTSKPPRIVTEKEVQASLAPGGATRAASATPAAPAVPAAPAAPRATASGAASSASARGAAVGTTASAQGSPSSSQRRLPKTASPLPLVALAGFASLAAAAALSVRRRRLLR